MEIKDYIIDIITNQSQSDIDYIFDEFYPIDIAIGLEEFEEEEIIRFMNLLSDERKALVLEQCEETLKLTYINHLSVIEMVNIYAYLPSDEIVDIVSELPVSIRKKVLNNMRKSESKEIRTLMSYGGETAGGIMTTEYIVLKENLTVKEAIEKIKEIGPTTEIIEVIFVVNDRDMLLGVVDLRDILIAGHNVLIRDITEENIITVEPDTDQEEVAQIVSKYDLKVIPVISKRNVILGIITIDDIIDVINMENTEDMLGLGGVSKDETYDSSITNSIKQRLPWLLVNLITAFIASSMVSAFSGVIAKVVILAAAMPIVAGLGGNAGAQTLSVVIRSIALGEISLQEDWKYVFKEASLGIIHGLSVGLVAGVAFGIRYHNMYLGVIILMAMVINLMIASFFGFLIPLLLKSIGIDPAVASSIFLTGITDTFGFFVFLGLASIFVSYLV